MNVESGRRLWGRIEEELERGLPAWRNRIRHLAQVPAAEARELGQPLSDEQVFEGLVRSVLSNSTDFAKVERVLPDLVALFRGFDLRWYAALTTDEIDRNVYGWFLARRAGSMTLRQDLQRLARSSKRLVAASDEHGSLETWIEDVHKRSGHDPKTLAIALAGTASPHKLPGLGVALAAEFLKNLGYDISKPDRHVNRAAGSFGFVRFRRWPDRGRTTPPDASEPELLDVMRSMEVWAEVIGERTAFLDNAVWLLCARSGLYFSNDRLAALAR